VIPCIATAISRDIAPRFASWLLTTMGDEGGTVMNIGAAATAAGVPAKTIRYYENVGLIPLARRTGSGYRLYSETDVAMLRFIQRARSLGFSVKDVSGLLELWRDRKRASADVRRVAQRHLADVGQKIDELRTIERTLVDLIERCHGDERPECPILEDLAGTVSEPVTSNNSAETGGS